MLASQRAKKMQKMLRGGFLYYYPFPSTYENTDKREHTRVELGNVPLVQVQANLQVLHSWKDHYV